MQGQKLWILASIHRAYLQGINLNFAAMAEVLAVDRNLIWTQANPQILSANLTAEVACVVQHWLVIYVALKERSTRHGYLPVSGRMQIKCHLKKKHGDIWWKKLPFGVCFFLFESMVLYLHMHKKRTPQTRLLDGYVCFNPWKQYMFSFRDVLPTSL